LAEALQRNGVRHELKLFPSGGHGIGLAEGTSAEGWFNSAFAFLQDIFEK